MRRPGEAVELHQGPVQRQLPGLRLPDSAREVPPGPPSRPAASCSPVSAPDSQPPRGGGRLRPGDAHLCEGSPSSRLSHPPSLPGNFRTSGHELAVRGSGPRGGEGQSPLPCPIPKAPSEGAWYPRRPGALPYLAASGGGRPRPRRGGCGLGGTLQRAARPRRCHARNQGSRSHSAPREGGTEPLEPERQAWRAGAGPEGRGLRRGLDGGAGRVPWKWAGGAAQRRS